ncbi:MAG: glycosyltransferase family 2 protein [Beduini sp.]|uniref:glycosyltransferase family 2 protein n=1 Tax=Beduini sp. TaxID=1922300 RepID=UPI0039A2EF54
MPKVSVIMGVYNVGDKYYLEQAIKSILKQSFTDFEFIICDDGSIDNTYIIIQKLIKDDRRCILIRNKVNQGLAKTLNNCISIAKGEYIARMDADDISLENRLFKQVEYLDLHPEVAVLGTQAYFIDKNGKRFKEFKRKKIISLMDTVKNSNLIHPTVMIRKNILLEVNGYSTGKLTTRAEDYDLWCKIAFNNYEIENLDLFLFEYREDINAYKKRKYKHRVEEYQLKKYWIKKCSAKKKYLLYAYKPLLVGLIPSSLMIRRKIR